MDYQKTALKIVEAVGGRANIVTVLHCITRLRFSLKDDKAVDNERINEIEGVLGSQFTNGQYQVIIGQEVVELFAAVEPLLTETVDETKEPRKKQGLLFSLLDVVASIFTPILPAIVGAGLMKGVIAVLENAQWLAPESDTYQLLTIIADAGFYFLPFLLAVSSAQKFKVNPYLALSLAGALLYPTMTSGLAEGAAPLQIGHLLPIPFVNYATSVIPIILGVWLMSYVYRWIDAVIPSLLRVILTPLLVLFVTVPITLVVLGPIGNYCGELIATVFSGLFGTYPVIAGLLTGALYPLMIIMGMHYATFPLLFSNLGKWGYDNGFFPVGFIANMAQAGASFAVALKTRNSQFRAISLSAGLSALFGITEPALYGVTVKLKKPLIATLISGSLSSGLALGLGVKCYGFVIPGLESLPVYVQQGSNNFLFMLLCISLSFILAFCLTVLLGFEDIPSKKEN